MWMGSHMDSGTGKRQSGLHTQSGMWENAEWRERSQQLRKRGQDHLIQSTLWENPLATSNQKPQKITGKGHRARAAEGLGSKAVSVCSLHSVAALSLWHLCSCLAYTGAVVHAWCVLVACAWDCHVQEMCYCTLGSGHKTKALAPYL